MQSTITKALNSWIADIYAKPEGGRENHHEECEVANLNEAPPLLFIKPTGPGTALQFSSANGPTLNLWIPETGQGGSWCEDFDEGEIAIMSLSDITDKQQLFDLLDDKLQAFRTQVEELKA